MFQSWVKFLDNFHLSAGDLVFIALILAVAAAYLAYRRLAPYIRQGGFLKQHDADVYGPIIATDKPQSDDGPPPLPRYLPLTNCQRPRATSYVEDISHRFHNGARCICLVGAANLGKTQIASLYGAKESGIVSFVFRQGRNSLADGCAWIISQQLGIPARYMDHDPVSQLLELAERYEFLVLLANVDVLPLSDLQRLDVSQHNARLLLTSSSLHLSRTPIGADVVEIHPLGMKESETFLLERLPSQFAQDHFFFRRLVQACHGHPLALQVLVAWIDRKVLYKPGLTAEDALLTINREGAGVDYFAKLVAALLDAMSAQERQSLTTLATSSGLSPMVQEGILLRTGGGTVFLHPAIAQHLPEKRELGPRSDEGIATLSQRYRDLGLRERIDQELIPVCKRQLEKSRDRAAWYRALGVCELSKAQARQCLLEPLKSAIGNFLSALSYDPDDRDTCRYLGLAYYACFELTRSRQDLQEAIAALRMSQDAHELAKAQLQLARLDEDTALARQLAEVEELSPGLKAWAMLLVGEDSYLRRASELLAQEDANLPTATRLNLLGCCLHKLGRKDEAVNTFRSCLEVLDRRPHPYVESSSEEERSIIERNLQQVELSKFGPSSSGLVTR